MSYDVYYATGGGSLVYGGSDVWVNNWLREIASKLDYPSKLLIHRRRPENIKIEYDSPIEIIWQGYNPRKFEETLKNARKIHILHGYYTPHRIIESNKDKLESVCVHVSVDLSLKAGFQLGLPKLLHFSANSHWEKQVSKWAKKAVWIGLDKIPLHDEIDIIDIPNYYEFKQNKKVCMSNRVGFAARCETRKSPHFLDGIINIIDIVSLVSIIIGDYLFMKKNMLITSILLFFVLSCKTDSQEQTNTTSNTKLKIQNSIKAKIVTSKGDIIIKLEFEKTRLYQFNYKNIHRFFDREDWGISHSCHLHEPFGYSIFQALDYGKLPILQKDWLINYEYPFRAFTKEEFNEQIDNISDLSEKERQDYLDNLRDYCRVYDNKEEWTQKYLEIYNQ